jgi:hypothetical protein
VPMIETRLTSVALYLFRGIDANGYPPAADKSGALSTGPAFLFLAPGVWATVDA